MEIGKEDRRGGVGWGRGEGKGMVNADGRVFGVDGQVVEAGGPWSVLMRGLVGGRGLKGRVGKLGKIWKGGWGGFSWCFTEWKLKRKCRGRVFGV